MMNGDLIPPNEKETGRLEAFSDGIFAIAITLLGLTLQVPDLGEDVSAAALAEALGQQWPSYIAFAISFFTILIVWLNHHAVFGLVRMADFLFLLANGFLLMLVTVVPITTEVATRYLGTPAASAATAVYAGTLFMVTVFHNLLWLSATYNRRLLKPSTPESYVRILTRNYLLGLPLYVTAIVLAFWNVYVSLGLCTLLWLIWALTPRGRPVTLPIARRQTADGSP
jgi:uncharacterized membrane protein